MMNWGENGRKGSWLVLTQFSITFNGGTEVNIEINFRRIGVRIQNHTGDLKNVKQNC
jgi:hypothetical protein